MYSTHEGLTCGEYVAGSFTRHYLILILVHLLILLLLLKHFLLLEPGESCWPRHVMKVESRNEG
jgi:hypothetical protein